MAELVSSDVHAGLDHSPASNKVSSIMAATLTVRKTMFVDGRCQVVIATKVAVNFFFLKF